MDLDATARQRERDPPGADPELERASITGERSEEVDRRLDDSRLEHPVRARVVQVGDVFAEGAVLVRHGSVPLASASQMRTLRSWSVIGPISRPGS